MLAGFIFITLKFRYVLDYNIVVIFIFAPDL